MLVRDAVAMLTGAGLDREEPAVWADLGAGDGTFTLALAEILPAGSAIHAIDRDRSVLRHIPAEHHGVTIETHSGDFTSSTWPFDGVDGVMMANSLHFVRDKVAFVRSCAARMRERRSFLIVEYDTDRGNTWVPYPISQNKLEKLFTSAGYASIRHLGTRPSIYQRAQLYAALVRS